MAKIAIVGAGCAGCAGLGAAATLLSFGHDVFVWEAGDRVGGRARTSSVEGLPIDLGPQFVQDPADNPWTTIMQALGIEGRAPGVGGLYRVLGEDGRWTTTGETPAMAVTMARLADGFAFAEEQPNRPPLPPTDHADTGQERQARMLALGSNGYGAIAESVEPWQYIAQDSARQKPAGDDDNIYVVGGIGNLVATYARRLSEAHAKLRIRTSTPIVRLASSDEGVTLSDATGGSDLYDYCIVTVPVPQIETLQFDPPLTPDRKTALGLIGLGWYKKVAFRPRAMPADIKVNREYYIYDSASDGCWQYFRLPTDPTILICVTAGDFARRLDEAPNDSVSGPIITLLGAAYAMEGFGPQGEVIVTNWTREPYIGGAYSYTRYDPRLPKWDTTAFKARIVIAEPHERIHFAGEATWTEAYGTIAGAYRSGERAAREICALL